MIKRLFLGLDLGQTHDFTAIAILERVAVKGDWDPVMFAHRMRIVLRIRYLDRIPLGTPYPDVVRRVKDLLQALAASGGAELLVDATGVGRPIVDLLRQSNLGAVLSPINITGALSESYAANGYRNVPKRDLFVGLQVAFQSGALQIAAGTPYAHELFEEMSAMRVKIGPSGTEQFGAWAEGTHDDLVCAVALACWGMRRAYPFDLSGEAKYWPVAM